MAAKAKTKSPATKKKAPKAKVEAKKPATPDNVYDEGTLVKFTGYRSDVEADEIVFAEGDTLYIIEHNDSDDGLLYAAIKAEFIAEYLENGDANVEGGEVSPTEVTALKGTALANASDMFMPIRQVGRMEDILAEYESPLDAALQLNVGIQESYFYMGGALAMVLQEGSHLTENGGDYSGEEAFADFCEAELGFGGSKGRQLARMYQTFSQIPDFDPTTLEGVGWSKAAIAERFVTAENVDEVLEVAAASNQRELAAKLKETYVKENGTTASGKAASRGAAIAKVSLSYRLDEDSADTVRLSIEACMKQTGLQSEDLALEHICAQWANDHVEGATAQKRINTKANKAKTRREKAAAEKEKKAAAAPAKKAPAKKAPAKKTTKSRGK